MVLLLMYPSRDGEGNKNALASEPGNARNSRSTATACGGAGSEGLARPLVLALRFRGPCPTRPSRWPAEAASTLGLGQNVRFEQYSGKPAKQSRLHQLTCATQNRAAPRHFVTIGARGGLRHHSGTAKEQCPSSSTVARQFGTELGTPKLPFLRSK